jgi:hypothetical protein
MLKTVVLGAIAAALCVLALPSELDAYGACRSTSYSRGGYGGGSYGGTRTATYSGSGGGSATRTSTHSGSVSGGGGSASGTRTYSSQGGYSSSGGVNPYVRASQSNYAGTVGTGYMAGEYHQVGGYGYVR